MHLNSASSSSSEGSCLERASLRIRLSVRSVCHSCDASTIADCFEASLLLLPVSSRAPHT